MNRPVYIWLMNQINKVNETNDGFMIPFTYDKF